MSLPRLRIGLTGHRNLPEPERVRAAIEAAIGRVEQLVPGISLAGVSSGAIGADTLFAEIMMARDLPWTLLLPFAWKKFFNSHDFPGASLARARILARSADNVVQVTAEPHRDDKRRASFLECSLCTVDECDVLIAIWDHQPGRPGGTESAVEHARQLGRPLILIDPDNGGLTEERLESLPVLVRSQPQLDIPAKIQKEFEDHTRRAKWSRPHAINLNILLVGLHQIATFVAIFALIFVHRNEPAEAIDLAACFKVAMLIFALLLPIWLRRKSDEWTDHRMQAEIIRSAICLWHLPNPAKVFEAVRPPAFEAMQAELLRQRMADSPVRSFSAAEFRQSYLLTRVAAQLEYYRRHVRLARAEHVWLHHLANLCTGLAILLGMLVGFHFVSELNPAHHTLKLLSISLPLVTTTILAAITARDVKRRMVRYADMAFLLQAARRQVELATTWDELSDAVIGVERRLLFEIWEWYSVTRYAGAH